MSWLDVLVILTAPLLLFIFTLITAYVYKFGKTGTGIYFDYILFSVVTIAVLMLGGAV